MRSSWILAAASPKPAAPCGAEFMPLAPLPDMACCCTPRPSLQVLKSALKSPVDVAPHPERSRSCTWAIGPGEKLCGRCATSVRPRVSDGTRPRSASQLRPTQRSPRSLDPFQPTRHPMPLRSPGQSPAIPSYVRARVLVRGVVALSPASGPGLLCVRRRPGLPSIASRNSLAPTPPPLAETLPQRLPCCLEAGDHAMEDAGRKGWVAPGCHSQLLQHRLQLPRCSLSKLLQVLWLGPAILWKPRRAWTPAPVCSCRPCHSCMPGCGRCFRSPLKCPNRGHHRPGWMERPNFPHCHTADIMPHESTLWLTWWPAWGLSVLLRRARAEASGGKPSLPSRMRHAGVPTALSIDVPSHRTLS